MYMRIKYPNRMGGVCSKSGVRSNLLESPWLRVYMYILFVLSLVDWSHARTWTCTVMFSVAQWVTEQ